MARGIMAVEAYHAGVIRTLLSKEFTTIVSPYNVPVSTITTAVATAVDGLLGLARKQPIGSPSGKPNLTPTDGNALVFAVNPDAVLNVVYLSKTATKGGFFPHGINGFFMKVRTEGAFVFWRIRTAVSVQLHVRYCSSQYPLCAQGCLSKHCTISFANRQNASKRHISQPVMSGNFYWSFRTLVLKPASCKTNLSNCRDEITYILAE